MKANSFNWNQLGISKKIGFSFSLLFVLLLLIVITAYISFYFIQRAENTIRLSTTVGHQVLTMDRGTEKARRLLNHFYIHYQNIGLQTAHEKYAQPSIRQTAQVINTAETLKRNIASPLFLGKSNINPVDVTLFLSSSKRFADLSIEFVQLITKRATPKRGLEYRMESLTKEMQNIPDGMHPQIHLQMQIVSSYKDYIIHRQRHYMQSSLNAAHALETSLSLVSKLSTAEKDQIKTVLFNYKNLAKELLNLDLEIRTIKNDFMIQEQTISPISETLIHLTELEVTQAQENIEQIYRYSRFIILTIVLFSIFAMLSIFTLLHKNITRKILALTETAKEIREGNLDARATVTGDDELGQLSEIFNSTTAKLDESLQTLEHKVEERTADLAESESRFRNLVSKLPTIAVQGYDSKRKITYWNQASERLYGYTAKEAVGQTLEDLILPDSIKEYAIAAIHDWHENGVEIPASEVTLIGKDDHEVQVYSTHVMLTSHRGEKCMYCIDQDLSDLKRAQTQEKRSESFYRQLFDHSSSGVAVYEAVDHGEDFIFRDFNKAGEEMDKVTREELLGRRVTEVFPVAKDFGILDTFRQVWQTGVPAHHPIFHYKDNRLQGWRENRIYRLPSGEIVAVYNDITKEKKLEEEKQLIETQLHRAQKMEAIGLMAGGVAHDLNNILSGITGYPELLLMQLPDDSTLREPLETIKQSGERAAAVVADLLTVARGVASSRANHNINTLILEYLASPEYLQLQKRFPLVKCSHTLEETIPAISCSSIHIKKCLMNLVTNGVEAIKEKGVVTIETTTIIQNSHIIKEQGLTRNTYVLLTITDTGTGIAEEDIEHIFEPFYTKKVMGLSGTGLGLAVVWNTVEDHEGKIVIKSSEKGTRFQLYFPATKQDLAPVKKGTVTKETLAGNNEHILVIDDEPILREIATLMLKDLGYQVDSVISGEEAIDFVTKTPVDLLLIDMLMEPGINGLQTYEKILTLNPQQKAVVASGFSKSRDVTKTLEIGAGAFIKKPYTIIELGLAVQKVLND